MLFRIGAIRKVDVDVEQAGIGRAGDVFQRQEDTVGRFLRQESKNEQTHGI